MSDTPHLGGFTAIALFVTTLVAAVVQSAITQVCRLVCIRYNVDKTNPACASLTWVPTAILSLVSQFVEQTPSLLHTTQPSAFFALPDSPSNNVCQYIRSGHE